MKKIISLILVLCMTMGIAACGSKQEAAPETAPVESEQAEVPSEEPVESTDQEAYELIFVCPIVGLEYWDMCADGIAAADAELGTKTQIVGPTDPATFTTEVINYIEAAISSQPDGIMTYCGIETVPPLIEKADGLGIPFMAIDSDAADSARIAYVGTDPYNAGYN